MIEPTKVQDQITAALSFWQSKKEIDKLATPEREKVLGLKFTPGERVRDSITGEEVRILGGIREIVGLPSPPSPGR